MVISSRELEEDKNIKDVFAQKGIKYGLNHLLGIAINLYLSFLN